MRLPRPTRCALVVALAGGCALAWSPAVRAEGTTADPPSASPAPAAALGLALAAAPSSATSGAASGAAVPVDDAPSPRLPATLPRAGGDAFADKPIWTRPIAPPDLAARAGAADATKADALADGDDDPGKLPQRAKVKECCGYPIGRAQDYRLTFYWLAYEAEYANEPYDTDIYTKDGWWIGRYPNAFVYELNLEGSGILRDGRVLNYDGHCRYGVGTCFKALSLDEHPLGRGVQARALVPFRSIAVDPRFIPIGSPVYVPELAGVQLPDGTRHDGCLRADDQGGAIKLHKMDFFVESYFNFKYLADQLWWRLKATPHLDEPRCEYLRLGHAREHDNEYCDFKKVHSKSYCRALAVSAKQNKKRAQVLASAMGGRKRSGKAAGRRR